MDLSSDIGLLRREVRDVRAVASNIDHKTKLHQVVQPSAYHRAAGSLVARFAPAR
jgi:hypothetical protein